MMAALVLMAIPFALTACAAKTSGSDSTGAVNSYADQTYGYSFQYPREWRVQKGDTASVTVGATAKGVVGVFNLKGSSSGGNYIDGVQVRVYELPVTVDKSMMPDVKTEVQKIFDQLGSQSGDWKALDSLADVTVGGLDGWTINYSFTSDGEPSLSRFYVVFGGNREYQLLVQASTKNWEADQPAFDAIVASFKPGAATTTTAASPATSSTSQ
jgi:hypothetical protein